MIIIKDKDKAEVLKYAARFYSEWIYHSFKRVGGKWELRLRKQVS